MAGLAALLGRSPNLLGHEEVDGEYGYDFTVTGYSFGELRELPDERLVTARGLVEQTLVPADHAVIAQELARLRAVTKARRVDEDEATLTFGVLREELAIFPPDVVRGALRKIARREVFFPTLAEMRDQCQREFRKRRMLAVALGVNVED